MIDQVDVIYTIDIDWREPKQGLDEFKFRYLTRSPRGAPLYNYQDMLLMASRLAQLSVHGLTIKASIYEDPEELFNGIYLSRDRFRGSCDAYQDTLRKILDSQLSSMIGGRLLTACNDLQGLVTNKVWERVY